MFDPCITHQFAFACKGLREISGPLSFQLSKDWHFSATAFGGGAGFERLVSWDVGPGRMSDGWPKEGCDAPKEWPTKQKSAPRGAFCLLIGGEGVRFSDVQRNLEITKKRNKNKGIRDFRCPMMSNEIPSNPVFYVG